MLVCYWEESGCRPPRGAGGPPPSLGEESGVPHSILLGDAEDAAGCSPGPVGFVLLATKIKGNKSSPKDGRVNGSFIPVPDPAPHAVARGCCKRVQLNVEAALPGQRGGDGSWSPPCAGPRARAEPPGPTKPQRTRWQDLVPTQHRSSEPGKTRKPSWDGTRTAFQLCLSFPTSGWSGFVHGAGAPVPSQHCQAGKCQTGRMGTEQAHVPALCQGPGPPPSVGASIPSWGDPRTFPAPLNVPLGPSPLALAGQALPFPQPIFLPGKLSANSWWGDQNQEALGCCGMGTGGQRTDPGTGLCLVPHPRSQFPLCKVTGLCHQCPSVPTMSPTRQQAHGDIHTHVIKHHPWSLSP
ncbi:uncharacterized protein LOC122153997 [Tyto alba]|uniref:uncharacterized protein LOC122153997 n=1 Tax=Tyto alba TaxID=56313 RepID=UPI001C666B67|nr:uncharacterized protein LOC122153997 [Tyto alba]